MVSVENSSSCKFLWNVKCEQNIFTLGNKYEIEMKIEISPDISNPILEHLFQDFLPRLHKHNKVALFKPSKARHASFITSNKTDQ